MNQKELAEEFRKLADEAQQRAEAPNNAFWQAEEAVQETWTQAAKMLEEKLTIIEADHKDTTEPKEVR